MRRVAAEVQKLRALLPRETWDVGPASTQEVPIRVLCRFRQQFEGELLRGGFEAWELHGDGTRGTVVACDATVRNVGPLPDFHFDGVFGPEADQETIYAAVEPVVVEVLRGLSGCILCYGQTSAGKTFTMEGHSEDLRGVIPRAIETVLEAREQLLPHEEPLQLRVSMLEIYMERLRDLFDPEGLADLSIYEDRNQGVVVRGLQELVVQDLGEAMEAWQFGRHHRAVATTGMNDRSSRSHCIFILKVERPSLGTSAKLSLVDLAGSENLRKTCLPGARSAVNAEIQEEAKAINQSLSTLGLVINRLSECRKGCAPPSHVPYRSSKLTRVLQDSLGGRSETALIINCSLSSLQVAETVSTLRFGMRARSCVNMVQTGTNGEEHSMLRTLRAARRELQRLQVVAESIYGLGVSPGHLDQDELFSGLSALSEQESFGSLSLELSPHRRRLSRGQPAWLELSAVGELGEDGEDGQNYRRYSADSNTMPRSRRNSRRLSGLLSPLDLSPRSVATALSRRASRCTGLLSPLSLSPRSAAPRSQRVSRATRRPSLEPNAEELTYSDDDSVDCSQGQRPGRISLRRSLGAPHRFSRRGMAKLAGWEFPLSSAEKQHRLIQIFSKEMKIAEREADKLGTRCAALEAEGEWLRAERSIEQEEEEVAVQVMADVCASIYVSNVVLRVLCRQQQEDLRRDASGLAQHYEQRLAESRQESVGLAEQLAELRRDAVSLADHYEQQLAELRQSEGAAAALTERYEQQLAELRQGEGAAAALTERYEQELAELRQGEGAAAAQQERYEQELAAQEAAAGKLQQQLAECQGAMRLSEQEAASRELQLGQEVTLLRQQLAERCTGAADVAELTQQKASLAEHYEQQLATTRQESSALAEHYEQQLAEARQASSTSAEQYQQQLTEMQQQAAAMAESYEQQLANLRQESTNLADHYKQQLAESQEEQVQASKHKEEQLAKLQQEAEHQKRQVKELQEEAAAAAQQVAQLQKESSAQAQRHERQLGEISQRHQQQLQELRQESTETLRHESTGLVQRYQQQLVDARHEAASLEQRYEQRLAASATTEERLQQQLAEARREAATAVEQQAALQQEAARAEQEAAGAEQRIALLQQEATGLAESYEQQLAELRQEGAGLAQHYEQQFAEMKAQCSVAEDKHAAAVRLLDEKADDVEELERQCKDLTARLEAAQYRLEQGALRDAETVEALQSERQEVARLQSQLASCFETQGALVATAKMAEDQAEDWKRRVKELEDALHNAKRRLSQGRATSNALRDAEQEREGLFAELKDLRTAKDAAEVSRQADRKEFTEREEELQRILVLIKQQIEEERSESRRHSQEHEAKHRAERRSLEESLEESQAKVEKLSRDFQDLKLDRDKLLAAQRQLQGRHEELRSAQEELGESGVRREHELKEEARAARLDKIEVEAALTRERETRRRAERHLEIMVEHQEDLKQRITSSELETQVLQKQLREAEARGRPRVFFGRLLYVLPILSAMLYNGEPVSQVKAMWFGEQSRAGLGFRHNELQVDLLRSKEAAWPPAGVKENFSALPWTSPGAAEASSQLRRVEPESMPSTTFPSNASPGLSLEAKGAKEANASDLEPELGEAEGAEEANASNLEPELGEVEDEALPEPQTQLRPVAVQYPVATQSRIQKRLEDQVGPVCGFLFTFTALVVRWSVGC